MLEDVSTATWRYHKRYHDKIKVIFSLLITFNVLIWLWAIFAFSYSSRLLGTAILAYTLGLRHAIDPDHLAAIDNVTRQLIQQGKESILTGFYFSLGHSSVVILTSACLALFTGYFVKSHLASLYNIGYIIGTFSSTFFLIFIAISNLQLFYTLFRTNSTYELKLGKNLSIVKQSWQMYPVGFLFGIGFDTASEIALLGLTAAQVIHGFPLHTILIFPALFTAGMIIIDSINNLIMMKAYLWTLAKPANKKYYNLFFTLFSALAALIIGGIQLITFFFN